MKLHSKFAMTLLSVAFASSAHAGQFITALNIDSADGDVTIERSSTVSGELVTDSYADTSVKAQTQLGINKVSGGYYGAQYAGVQDTGMELSGTSAWLDTFTAKGCAGCMVDYTFTFTVDGAAQFTQGPEWNTTHFNFQVVALRGDNWTIHGRGEEGWLSTPNGMPTGVLRTPGTDFDELYFERKPGGSGLVTQMGLREENEVFYNFNPDANGNAGTFNSSAQTITDSTGTYYLRTQIVGSGLSAMVQYVRLYENGYEVRNGSNNGSAVRQAYVPGLGYAIARAGLEANFSLLDTASLCGMDDLAGEKQCAPGTWGPTPITVSFSVLAGSRFSIAGVMTMDELDDGYIDFFNTAKLSDITATNQNGTQAGLESDSLGVVVDINTGKVTYPSAVPGAVPEPASWAMMIGGLGLVGGLLRRRRTMVRAAA